MAQGIDHAPLTVTLCDFLNAVTGVEFTPGAVVAEAKMWGSSMQVILMSPEDYALWQAGSRMVDLKRITLSYRGKIAKMEKAEVKRGRKHKDEPDADDDEDEDDD